MKTPVRAKWVTYREVPLWCCDFGGFGSDRDSLVAEIAAAQAVIDRAGKNSLLIAVDLNDATLSGDIIAFFKCYAGQALHPVRRMAILGVSGFQRCRHRRVWPKTARFFDDWEQAKKWLVTERF
jgi:hypothetical protein